ncbi:kelch-like protein 20 [Dendronephthya gigantea]|uniref:kelch-like protein 20 n=1 Tax=Dendronephthya gigantea TaxID=151771 RepID=UPI00106D66C5|nr:kelch-like protein 20 [Dendronephthya gigantea]
MTEKQQTKVHLKTVPSTALAEVLDYLYTGSLRVTKNSVAELIFTSSLFLLLDLTEYCWEVFVKTLDVKNCIARKILADSVSSGSIARTVTNFVLQNFANLDSETLTSCPAAVLRMVLASEDLIVSSELEVLRCLLKWLNGQHFLNSIHEKDFQVVNLWLCEELLKLVRFKFISLSEDEFVALLQSYGLSEHHWFQNTILEKFKTNSGCSEARLSYRNVEVIIAVGGQGESSILNEVSAYILDRDHWFEITPMQYPRRSFSLVSTENTLYAIGGTMEKVADTPVSWIERYDAHKDTWEDVHVTSLSELERDNAAIVGLNDHIVISGGFSFTSCSVTSSVIMLNPCNGESRELSSLDIAREGHATVVDDLSIYVIGGKNESGCLASVERFNNSTETWEVLAPMNNNRAHFCAIWHKNNIYAFGGHDGENVLNSVEVYNPNSNQWQLLPEGMSTPRMKFALSLCGDEAFVIGGMVGSRGPMTSDVEKYSFVKSTWSSVRSMDKKRMEFSCATLSLCNNALHSFIEE